MRRGFTGIVQPGGMIGTAVAEHDRCEVLFAGHISNRDDVGRALGLAVERTDNGRVVAAAFRRWGEALTDHVFGEFALAVHDRADGTTLLAHDSLGLASLYVRTDDPLRFATHIVDLLDAAVLDEIDEDYLADFIVRGYIAGPRTPFRRITRLAPGQALRVTPDRRVPCRQWSIAAVVPQPVASAGEYREAFRAVLSEAVRGAADGCATVWTHLSGGLDSSTIAAVAARERLPGLAAWSVYCPSFGQADERRWMQALIDAYPMDWRQVDAEARPPFSAPPASFIGEPTNTVVHDAQARATFAEQSAAGVDAVLSGHGGDAVLGAIAGPDVLAPADRLYEQGLGSALAELARWQREMPERRSRLHWLTHSLVAPAVRHLAGLPPGTAPPLQPWLAVDYRRTMRLDARYRVRIAARCRTPSLQVMAASLDVAALQMARDNQRRDVLPVRCPLMDRRLVAFMAAVPSAQRLQPHCDRYLQRHALNGILPDLIRKRSGKGIGAPVFLNGLERSRAWIDYLTSDSRLVARGMADRDRWDLAVRQASVGQTNGDQFFHAGLAVEVWLRQLEQQRADAGHRTDNDAPGSGQAGDRSAESWRIRNTTHIGG